MRALKVENGRLLIDNTCEPPVVEPHEALVRIICSGICGTDLEIVNGYKGFTGVLGHEFVGRVEQAADKSLTGKRVVGEINCICHTCDNCMQGRESHCTNRQVMGIKNRDGSFADYISLPVENLHPVPDTVPDKAAVFTEPLAAALQVMERVHIKPAYSAVVIGDGKLGILTASVLNLTGCGVLTVGRNPKSRDILAKSSISFCFEKEMVPGPVADVVVDCSGDISGIELAEALVKPKGKIVLKTTTSRGAPLNLTDVVVNELVLAGSRCGPFKPALNILERELVDVSAMIDAVYTIDEGEKAFERAGEKGTLKVLISFE